MAVPLILTRYRSLIVSGLETALRGDSLLYPVLRYHIGLEDERGNPADHLGKLLRPSLVLFTADELGADPKTALPAAIGLELIHNFSLIHDDIQDGDSLRRGRPTVWSRYGTAQGINAGDLMETLAVREALAAGPEVAEELLSATIAMIEGQALDLSYETQEVSVEEYMEMVDKKTGALIRSAFTLGGIIANVDAKTRTALSALGTALGRAFQIRDDILGIWGNDAITGKPCGSDIRRQKKSLPVVIGLSHATGADSELLIKTYQKAELTDSDVTAVVKILERVGAREAGEEMVNDYLHQAQDELARLTFSNAGKAQMEELIKYLARREK